LQHNSAFGEHSQLKKIFKKKENLFVNINYYNKKDKLVKKEQKEISGDEYLLLSQERKANP
jgi:hypothetical protein